MKALESQISELEAEASRLLRALDQAKEAKAEVERTQRKKAEDAAKEIASQVNLVFVRIPATCAYEIPGCGDRNP